MANKIVNNSKTMHTDRTLQKKLEYDVILKPRRNTSTPALRDFLSTFISGNRNENNMQGKAREAKARNKKQRA